MVSVGGREGLVETLSTSHTGAGEPGSQSEITRERAVRQTEEEYLWSWDTSSLYAETTDNGDKLARANLALAPLPSPPRRRPMPKRVKVALLIFLIVGALALTVDGFLLILSLTRHHTQPPTVQTSQPDPGSLQLQLTPISQTAPTPDARATSVNGSFFLSSSHLSFVVMQGQLDPTAQTVVLSSSKSSSFSWEILSAQPSWLNLSSTQGDASVGASSSLSVSVQADQLVPGTYATHLQIKAIDGQEHTLPNGIQILNVTLSVLTPCSLAVNQTKLSFSADLLQSDPSTQTLRITERGDCARPVNWHLSANVSWITFSNASGQDDGSGSTITVLASNSNKLVGKFNATILLEATDSNDTALTGSPTTIAVTLTVIVV